MHTAWCWTLLCSVSVDVYICVRVACGRRGRDRMPQWLLVPPGSAGGHVQLQGGAAPAHRDGDRWALWAGGWGGAPGQRVGRRRHHRLRSHLRKSRQGSGRPPVRFGACGSLLEPKMKLISLPAQYAFHQKTSKWTPVLLQLVPSLLGAASHATHLARTTQARRHTPGASGTPCRCSGGRCARCGPGTQGQRLLLASLPACRPALGSQTKK